MRYSIKEGIREKGQAATAANEVKELVSSFPATEFEEVYVRANKNDLIIMFTLANGNESQFASMLNDIFRQRVSAEEAVTEYFKDSYTARKISAAFDEIISRYEYDMPNASACQDSSEEEVVLLELPNITIIK